MILHQACLKVVLIERLPHQLRSQVLWTDCSQCQQLSWECSVMMAMVGNLECQSQHENHLNHLRIGADTPGPSSADALSSLISDLTLVWEGILPSEFMLAILCISFPVILALVVKLEMGTYLPAIFGHVILLNYHSYQLTSFHYRTKRLLSLPPLYTITPENLTQVISTLYTDPIQK